MDFRIADTFTESLAKLTAPEQKAVKTTAFDLQVTPSATGANFHRIKHGRDKNFWSISVNNEIRIIAHRREDSLLLAYVDHHDKAYSWAERRRIETHPRTGAVQIVETLAAVEEIAPPPAMIETNGGFKPAQQAVFPFAGLPDEALLSIGAPEDWLDAIRAASEDSFFDLAPHLPEEASEALLNYAATGIFPAPPPPEKIETIDPFAHPDAQRRFRIIDNVEELKRALDYPWEKWTVFLHPSQRSLVEQDFDGPARVMGSAGTGKTIVALHRAVRFAQADPEAFVLLTTFSRPLAFALERKLRVLSGPPTSLTPRVIVGPIRTIAEDLLELASVRRPLVASEDQIRAALAEAAEDAPESFAPRFLFSEWTHVADAWQAPSFDSYLLTPRIGLGGVGARLTLRQRERVWRIFKATRLLLESRGLATWPQIYAAVSEMYAAKAEKPFTHVVVDEAQELGVAELRFLAAIAPDRPNALFFSGDLGQRIFKRPFSWLAVGVDVRGRSETLKVNYRTSHQIRRAADSLLPGAVRDMDGLEQGREGTVSVFDGPEPQVAIVADEEEEIGHVAGIVRRAVEEGASAEEIGIFVRTRDELPRVWAAIAAAGQDAIELSERGDDPAGRVSIGTMHQAKGLEFKTVVIMACDAALLPLASRMAQAADESDMDEAVETERHLFYVACTRARDNLYVSGIAPGSEFLKDLVPER